MKAPSFFIETEDEQKMMLQYRFVFLHFCYNCVCADVLYFFQDQAKRVPLLRTRPGAYSYCKAVLLEELPTETFILPTIQQHCSSHWSRHHGKSRHHHQGGNPEVSQLLQLRQDPSSYSPIHQTCVNSSSSSSSSNSRSSNQLHLPPVSLHVIVK